VNSRVARYVTSCVSVWKLINLLALVTVCSVSAALPMSLHNALSAAEHTARLTDRLSNHCSKQLLETAFGRTLLRKVYTVNAAICIAHRHEHVSNALPLPISRRWSPLASHQPSIQRTLRDHGHGLVCHAICLFTLPAFARYSFQPAQRAGSGWIGLSVWFRADVVYPSKDGNPPRL